MNDIEIDDVKVTGWSERTGRALDIEVTWHRASDDFETVRPPLTAEVTYNSDGAPDFSWDGDAALTQALYAWVEQYPSAFYPEVRR